jgi:hypothetical protein
MFRDTGSCKRFKQVGRRRVTFCRYGFPHLAVDCTTLGTMTECEKERGKGKPGQFYKLARSYKERWVNAYNPTLLLLWQVCTFTTFIPILCSTRNVGMACTSST